MDFEDFERSLKINRKSFDSHNFNSAGCDKTKMEEMDIECRFLEQQFEIIQAYDKLGIETSLSCTPYDTGKICQGYCLLGRIQRSLLCKFMD